MHRAHCWLKNLRVPGSDEILRPIDSNSFFRTKLSELITDLKYLLLKQIQVERILTHLNFKRTQMKYIVISHNNSLRRKEDAIP